MVAAKRPSCANCLLPILLLRRKFCLLQLEIEFIFHGDVVSLGQRAEAIDPLHGAHGGHIEAGRAASGLDASIRWYACTVDVEDDSDALSVRGARVGFLGKPVLRDGAVDDVDVVGKTCAESLVLNADAGGAVLKLHSGL